MPDSAAAPVSNSLHNTSSLNDNSSDASAPDQLLRERYADRITATLQQPRIPSTHDTDVAETTIEDHVTSARFDSDLGRVIDFPDLARVTRTAPNSSFHLLQEWEGYVILKGKEDFTVRLLDLTTGSKYEEEEAVIPFSEITDDERKCMGPGSIFRWVIGYERSASGTKQRVSRIVFRDLPVLTKQEITEADQRAKRTSRLWAD